MTRARDFRENADNSRADARELRIRVFSIPNLHLRYDTIEPFEMTIILNKIIDFYAHDLRPIET